MKINHNLKTMFLMVGLSLGLAVFTGCSTDDGKKKSGNSNADVQPEDLGTIEDTVDAGASADAERNGGSGGNARNQLDDAPVAIRNYKELYETYVALTGVDENAPAPSNPGRSLKEHAEVTILGGLPTENGLEQLSASAIVNAAKLAGEVCAMVRRSDDVAAQKAVFGNFNREGLATDVYDQTSRDELAMSLISTFYGLSKDDLDAGNDAVQDISAGALSFLTYAENMGFTEDQKKEAVDIGSCVTALTSFQVWLKG